MFTTRTWMLIGVAIIAGAVWYSSQTLAYVYSETSQVICGEAPAMLFSDEFNADVRGPATQRDCVRLARTRMVEVIGLGLIGISVGYLGYRFAPQPPRPIDHELPRLPVGVEKIVEGRKRRRK